VPQEAIRGGTASSRSQARIANANVPLLCGPRASPGGDLLLNGLIKPEDIDPIAVRHPTEPGAEQRLVALAPPMPHRRKGNWKRRPAGEAAQQRDGG